MAYDFSQGYGSVHGADPLGIAVQSRGLDRRFNFAQQNPGSSFGPLPSAAWEGLFQAMQEQGVDRVAGGEVPGSNAFTGVKQLPNRWGANEGGVQGFEPASGQKMGNLPGYGAPDDRNQIINGLNQAFIPMGQGYQTHSQWMAQNAPPLTQSAPGAWNVQQSRAPRRGLPVIAQRGTTGSNMSQRYQRPNPNE